MFEDLVKQKKIPIEQQIKQCPYCGSYLIQKSDRKGTIDDQWTQKITCRICNKNWAVLYNEDQSPQRVIFDKCLKEN